MIPEGEFLKKAFCVGVDSSLDAFLSVCAGFFFGYGFLGWGLVVIGNVFKFVPIVAIILIQVQRKFNFFLYLFF